MCDPGDTLTPAAREQVGAILAEIVAAVAARYGCDPADVVVGPVDLGPPPEAPADGHAAAGARAPTP